MRIVIVAPSELDPPEGNPAIEADMVVGFVTASGPTGGRDRIAVCVK